MKFALATFHRALATALLTVLLASESHVHAQSSASIYAATLPPNWPTTLAAVIPATLKLSSAPVFTWSFPTAQNPSCTADGRQNVSPCVGRVVDHWFPTASRNHTVVLTITDSTLSSPMRVEQRIVILAAGAQPQAKRPEIRAVPKAMWTDKYVPAFYRMKELGVYDHLAAIHRAAFSVGVVPGAGTQRSIAHSTPAFLPWHRVFSRIFERCLQEAANDSRLGLPYWDWLQGFQGVESYFGADGDKAQDGVLTTGPFAKDKWVLPADYPSPVKAVHRSIGTEPGFRFMTQQELDAMLQLTNYDLPPFNEVPNPQSFRSTLEGWNTGGHHNGIHRWMGGTMANVVHSFHDPIFQIHHVQVDRVFTLWQQARKCADGHGSSECYRPGVTDPGVNANLPGAQQNRAPDGQLRFALVGAMFNDAMYPWNVALNEALVADQGYTYLAPGQAPPETKTDVDEEDGGEDAQDPNGSGRAQDPVKQDESTKRGDAAVVRHEVSGVLLCAIAIALTW